MALKFGKGRVLVQGEAAMLSAQISGAEKRRMGMNVPGNDNRQYALNLMHWLSGLLKRVVWDKKRQLIWIVGGVLMGTYVAYSNSITDEGEFRFSFFIFMETLILLIMGGLFSTCTRGARLSCKQA